MVSYNWKIDSSYREGHARLVAASAQQATLDETVLAQFHACERGKMDVSNAPRSWGP